jgi:hypothetical protein
VVDDSHKKALGARALWVLLAATALVLLAALSASRAYASEGGAGGEAPTIEAVGVSAVNEHAATLEAQIDPNGAETTYEFWLSYAVCQSGRYRCESVSVEPRGSGAIAAGDMPATVSTELSDLTPGYVYSYWVIATSSAGSTTSARNQFKALAQPPSIDGESVSQVTPNDATLEAQIDPNGAYTGYEFQIDVDGSYDFTQPVCPFLLPGVAQCESIDVGQPLPEGLAEPPPSYLAAELEEESVSLDLASIGATLQPATTYHYRVLAANSGETVVGPDQTFTTAAAPSLPAAGSSESPAAPQPPVIPGAGGQAEAGGDPQPASPSISVANSSVPSDAQSPRTATGRTASKLAGALRACERMPRRRRSACRARVETKYDTTARATTKRAREPSGKPAH